MLARKHRGHNGTLTLNGTFDEINEIIKCSFTIKIVACTKYIVLIYTLKYIEIPLVN